MLEPGSNKLEHTPKVLKETDVMKQKYGYTRPLP